MKKKEKISVENTQIQQKPAKKQRKTLYQLVFKRFFDFVLSLLAIIILSPLLLITWVLHKIFIGGGKAIFVQYRPGKDGKVFKLYKFRSMTNKTDENGNLLPDNLRITKFGKFLRKTSIDELPQLFNILKGDMSIVGPRPRMLVDVIFYDEAALETYGVRPGLTGLDQVSGGRSKASWEDTFEIDRKYMQKVTFFRDLWIILKTPFAMFGGAENGAETGGKGLYKDYLLNSGKITKQQYDLGTDMAKQLAANNSVLNYQPKLHSSTQEKESN